MSIQTVGISQKSWFSAVALFIKALARLLINTTNVLNDGVAMAEKTVSSARQRQLVDLTVSNRNYEADAVDVAALQRMKTRAALIDFTAGDPARQAMLDQEQTELKAIIAQERAKLEAERAGE